MTNKETELFRYWLIKCRNYAAHMTRTSNNVARAMKDIDRIDKMLAEIEETTAALKADSQVRES